MKYVYAVCYCDLMVFKNKESAVNFFQCCFYGSEGSEHERYANILVDLMSRNIGKDRVSDEINCITFHDEKGNCIEKIETNWQNYESAIKEIENE